MHVYGDVCVCVCVCSTEGFFIKYFRDVSSQLRKRPGYKFFSKNRQQYPEREHSLTKIERHGSLCSIQSVKE